MAALACDLHDQRAGFATARTKIFMARNDFNRKGVERGGKDGRTELQRCSSADLGPVLEGCKRSDKSYLVKSPSLRQLEASTKKSDAVAEKQCKTGAQRSFCQRYSLGSSSAA